jgi:hypothetical protein
MHAGGTEDVLRLFLRSFEASPAAMLGAFEPLHLPSTIRHSTLASLQSAVKVRPCTTPHEDDCSQHLPLEPLHLPSALCHSTLASLQLAVKVCPCMAGDIT